MAAESANSSWHPALMPDSSEAVAPSTQTGADAIQSTSSAKDALVQPDEYTTHESQPHDDTVASKTDNGNDDGDAWLGSGASTEKLPDEQAAENTEQDTAPKPKGPVSQHSSSMSFARTVSHEVNYDDDDEDTDPFKFMPPSDRTNSFPVTHNEQPLPSNQALDLMEENERDVNAEEQEYQQGSSSESPAELNAPKRQHASSVSIGGDVQTTDLQASEARYEEGIPLISHAETGHSSETPGAAASSFKNAGDEDDFFSQIPASNNHVGPNELPVQPLERKSTMQVLDSVDPTTVSHQSTLEGTPEELEEKPEIQTTSGNKKTGTDLAAKWEEAFADDDDDDFLLEDSGATNKEVDPAAFFGSDDEGFLDDDEPATAPQSAPVAAPTNTSPYAPQKPPAQRAVSYTPTTTAPLGGYNASAPTTTPYGSAPQYGTPPQPSRPEMPRAQSYADKSKGGYASPYDLPSDLVTPVVKPRKRASMQQLPQATGPPQAAPPRSASMYNPGPPSSTLSPPSSSHGQGPPMQQGPPHQKPPTPSLQHKDSFFEELPMASRPRPSSRTSIRAPSPAQHPPPTAYSAPPMGSATNQMPPPPLPAHALPPSSGPASQPSGIPNLVAPDKVNPYAAMPGQAPSLPPPAANTSRYSPAPGALGAHVPPAANSRYSPAPPTTKTHASYGPVAASAVPPPILPHQLPHQPRTSSPLTHVETNHGLNGEMTLAERRMSSSFEPRLHRVSSLPPTREVDEEEEQSTPNRSLSATHVPPAHTESRYSPRESPKATRRTPPPPSYAGQLTLSPPKQSGPSYVPHVPHAPPTAHPGFTQSPSASFGHRQAKKSSDSTRRPSSAHSHTSPVAHKTPSIYAPVTRTRGQSITMNMVAPTDGRENDNLQRWKGVPVFTWGVGGTLVTSFPNSVPRYGIKQAVPTIIRTPGEIKIRNIKDLEPLTDRLAKFPGPLKGKSKKKETIAWLSAGIETLEKDLPEISFHTQLSLEAKRTIERVLLWKILRVFIEHDGVLEGTPEVEKAVREVLSPGTVTPTADDDALFTGSGGMGVEATSLTTMQADGADVSTMDQVRHHLLRGDQEKAVWALVDKRLWGHAMLISHTVSGDLYKQVAQEFVRKEVNFPGHHNESMAALYKILSGNHDDCVDELVPVHARAGLQLMSTQPGGPEKDTLDGLDKWRETLCLVLSNRSVDDIQGLKALGNLLSSYGRAEAAHICFLFGRNASVFGGLDDPNANFVLLGSDHHQQSDQFAKETEALQLSEVYEYGLSLAGGQGATAGTPHLSAYKLQHAMTLAEYGFRDKALQYCESIVTAMTSQTKRSPYHHFILEAALDDFIIRLKQAPKEESNSWISKPSMNKVSDSMWNRFNKFVAGDELEKTGNGAGEGEAGPFGRITTPTISRSPSLANFDPYSTQSPAYPQPGAHAPTSAAASRYAPGAATAATGSNPYEPTSQYAPRTSMDGGRTSVDAPRASMERASSEYARNSYEPSYPSAMSAPPTSYAPVVPPAPEPAHQPAVGMPGAPGLAPAAQIMKGIPAYQPFGLSIDEAEQHTEPQQGYQPVSYGYEPPSLTTSSWQPDSENKATVENKVDNAEGPYSYEPPSYEPDPPSTAEDGEDAPKPKKKSFMDDDDDDIPAMNSKEKTKSEKDRENEEMFRKAAEEDAKRAAAQQPAKKGWGFSGWFGGGKKAEVAPSPGEASPGKAIRAKLGEASSFVYDPDLKRWVNKKPGAENTPAKTATPPPPKGMGRSVSGTPPPPTATPPPPMGPSSSAPPPAAMPLHMRAATPELRRAPSMDSIGLSAPPPLMMARSVSNGSIGGPGSAPPSRPTTSMSNASSIDDLLGAAGARKPGEKKKARKSGRYVDVMAK
ncbi:Sec23-binding domain of Sec16-domain-containing protein [Thelonectria olida]|uniref:Protein transport protein sec16 n=1 Tax=Thelonectria olida TaxID=1576542 RepID=A0A9P8W7Q4_9HYPO|nr:Sec23-binding domain of Sec16-domain-containing protein [Thelonectria olida]